MGFVLIHSNLRVSEYVGQKCLRLTRGDETDQFFSLKAVFWPRLKDLSLLIRNE